LYEEEERKKEMLNFINKNRTAFIFIFLAALLFYESFWAVCSVGGAVALRIVSAIVLIVGLCQFKRKAAEK